MEQEFTPEQKNQLQDYLQAYKPVPYSDAAIDKIIITASVSANTIIRKVPYFEDEIVFLLDEKGEKIPIKDEQGNFKVNENGIMQYVIKEVKKKQVGFTFKIDYCPSSEPFSPDMTSTYLTERQRDYVMQMVWLFAYYQRLQMNSKRDYSFRLHKIVNDINALIVPQKSFNAGSVSAVKTFRSLTQGNAADQEALRQKRGGVGGIVDAVLGEKKQAPKPAPEKPFYMY